MAHRFEPLPDTPSCTPVTSDKLDHMTNIAEQLADGFSNTGVKLAYGEPIEIEGTTIVPVAAASYGFGAGEGVGDAEHQEGTGGGGGGMSVPVGAYITQNGTTRFEPNPVALLAVSIPLVCVAGWSLTRVIKAWKR